jgi:tetratricopeptide (TPR) repeat protein
MMRITTLLIWGSSTAALLSATPVLAQVDSVRARTLPGRQVAEKAYNAGLTSFNARNYSAALTNFDQAVAAKPDFAAAYANRAATRLALKQYPAAIADYDQALKIEPSAYAALFGRGQAREAAGLGPEAEADYGEALKANPSYAPAWYNRVLNTANIRLPTTILVGQ